MSASVETIVIAEFTQIVFVDLEHIHDKKKFHNNNFHTSCKLLDVINYFSPHHDLPRHKES